MADLRFEVSAAAQRAALTGTGPTRESVRGSALLRTGVMMSRRTENGGE
jgi:hypothetical protein